MKRRAIALVDYSAAASGASAERPQAAAVLLQAPGSPCRRAEHLDIRCVTGDPEQTPGTRRAPRKPEFFIEEAGDAAGVAAISKRLEHAEISRASIPCCARTVLRARRPCGSEVLAQVCNVDFPALDTGHARWS